MTKLEALAKDCIENHTHRLVDKPTKQDIYLREESIFIQGYRKSEKRIEELEKENAELKERFKHRNCLDCSNHHINIKLFKAKEIIREFVEWATWQGNSKCPSFKSIQDKAEQFLNSEVEK